MSSGKKKGKKSVKERPRKATAKVGKTCSSFSKFGTRGSSRRATAYGVKPIAPE